MADITVRNQGNISDEGKVNWRSGDSGVVEGDQSIFDTSSVQLAQLGQVKVVGDRVFRYAQVNATLKPGQLTQSTLVLAQGTGGAADPSGGKTVTFFFSSAAASGTVAANFYAEGMVYFGAVGTSTQMGMGYRVKSHPIITTSGTQVLSLYEPLKYQVVTTDNLVLIANPYAGVIVNTGTASFAAGVCPVNATTGDYVWLQTAGPAVVQNLGTGVPGTPLVATATGAIAPWLIATTGTQPAQIAISMITQTTGFPGAVWLTIEP